jgi:hypothetical protein
MYRSFYNFITNYRSAEKDLVTIESLLSPEICVPGLYIRNKAKAVMAIPPGLVTRKAGQGERFQS